MAQRPPVRIANCSGFYGDRVAAAREMLAGPIDVLTGDYLAELTMLILWKARRQDPRRGYAVSFLRQMEGGPGPSPPELTMLVLRKGLRKDPARGHALPFRRQMEEVLGPCLERGVKVVAN